MPLWVAMSVGTFVLWGVWGFLAKVASQHLDARSSAVMQGLGVMAVTLVLLATQRFRPGLHLAGTTMGLLAGVALFLGIVTFTSALAHGGKAAVVVPISALYPIVTIALAVTILRESVTPTQAAGAGLALVAIWLMTR